VLESDGVVVDVSEREDYYWLGPVMAWDSFLCGTEGIDRYFYQDIME